MKNFKKSENKENKTIVNGYYEEGNTVRVYEEQAVGNSVKAEPDIIPYEVTEVIGIDNLKPQIIDVVDVFSAVILAIAVLVTLYMCVNYLQIRSDIVQLEKEISTFENNISEIKKENDAFECALNSVTIDFDYVYETATNEFGMVFPIDNEIVFYASEGGSYYRDYASVK